MESINVLDVLDELLQLPPDQRQARLESLDLPVEIMARLKSCLAHQRQEEDFLAVPPAVAREAMRLLDGQEPTCGLGADHSLLQAIAPEVRPQAEQPGTRVGRYKILQQIGEGGFGVVFMAEQEHPVRRTVALKILKAGMDTKQVIARFEAERQALAMMDHPNIARVIDAGSTDTGRPYFVMELVRGSPITEYCDKHQLPPRARLELFVQVCNAVQHAHGKGIIHRDLKPTNVLVTVADDGRAVPKIIDFGIAKATAAGQRLTDRTLFTEFRQLLGTPLYMSPEQAESDAMADVDTRSDVYALGVLLYELLTGTTPFAKERLASAAYEEVRRILREEEPPAPSTRLTTMGDALTAVATSRRTDPKGLGRLLKGDLDWIVMRALDKDRARRYETANSFARDIERYLADEQVEACPPSRMYRLRKYARRHRPLLFTSATIALVLVLATAVSVWQARRAVRERDVALAEKKRADEQQAIARAVSEFVTQDVLAKANPLTPNALKGTANRDLKVREALDLAAGRVSKRFARQPQLEIAIRTTLGDTYRGLAEHAKSEQQLDRALRLARETLGEQHPTTIDCMTRLGRIYRVTADFRRAEELLRQAFECARVVCGEQSVEAMDPLAELGILSHLQGDYARAESLLVQVLAVQRRDRGDEHFDTLDTTSSLASVYEKQSRYDKAEPLRLRALELHRKIYGEENPSTVSDMYNLAIVHLRRGRYAEAEALLAKVLKTRQKVLGDQHPQTLQALQHLGQTYFYQGHLDKAEHVFEQTFQGQRAILGDDHPDTVTAMNSLAMAYYRRGRYADAEPLFVRALRVSRSVEGPKHPDTLITSHNLASVYAEQRRYADAEALYREMLAVGQDFQTFHPDAYASAALRFAEVLERQGKLAEAANLARQCLALPEHNSASYRNAKARSLLGELLAQQGQFQDAERHLLAAYEQLTAARLPPWEVKHTDQTADRIVQMYAAWGKSEEAAAWRAKRPTTSPATRSSHLATQ